MANETQEHGEEGRPDEERPVDARWRELTTAANEALARLKAVRSAQAIRLVGRKAS